MSQRQEADDEWTLTLKITRQSGIIMSAFGALSVGAIE